MCEWCGKVDKIETTKLAPKEAAELLCEDESEYESGEMCGAQATYRTKARSVDMHICERHLKKLKEDMDEGLGELLQSATLAQRIVAKPIQNKERCEEFDWDRETECGKPADYAYIVTQETYSCDQHKIGGAP